MTAPLAFDAARPPLHFYAAPMPDAVRLDASNPKWIQLCAEGRYVYRGQETPVTGVTFDQMIANFRANPAYKPDGRTLFGRPAAEVEPLVLGGGYGVIALNFDHPPAGAPRPGRGWFLELERRGTGLWGLCFFDADAYAGMLGGTWKWTSIEWTSETVDNKGAAIGAYLSGVALTNDPFIAGMTPIQMSRCPGCEALQLGCDGRKMAGALDTLLPEEQRFVDGLTDDDLRRFADYPWDECVADQKKRGLGEERASKICGAIKARNQARLARARPHATLRNATGPANIPPQEIPMPDPTPPTLFARHAAARLSALLGAAVVPEDDAALTKSFDAYGSRYDQAMAAVSTLESAFGTSDPKQLADKLASLIALKEQMSALLPEMAAAASTEDTMETEMATQDVAQVMSAQRLDPAKHPGTVTAYTAQRLGGRPALVVPTAEQVAKDPGVLVRFFGEQRARREARPGLRKAFLKAHGIDAIVPVPAQFQHLYGANLFSGNGAIFGVEGAGTPPAQGQQQQQAYSGAQLGGQQPPPVAFTWARVSQLPPAPKGDNYTQRIFEEVARTEFGGDTRGPRYDQAWSRTSALVAALIRTEGPPPASLTRAA